VTCLLGIKTRFSYLLGWSTSDNRFCARVSRFPDNPPILQVREAKQREPGAIITSRGIRMEVVTSQDHTRTFPMSLLSFAEWRAS